MSKRVGDCQPIKTRFLIACFIYLTLHKMGDAIQLLNLSEVHNCPAVWNVSFLASKKLKATEKKIEVRGDKLGFVETFLFLQRFLFLLFSSSVSLFY